jgi:hypothetical protein
MPEVLQCVREYRVKAEFTLGRVIDVSHRKRVAPAIGLCCCRRILPFMLCDASYKTSSRCRSSCGALRPAEVVFRSLRYTVTSPADPEPWVHSLDGLDSPN